MKTNVYHSMGNGIRTTAGALSVSVFLLGALLFPAFSMAAGLSGDSRTYALSRETDEKIIGIYEYLDFAVRDLGKESISFHSGGWLRYDLKGEASDKKKNSDLQYGYLSFKRKTDNTVLNLGRVMVFEGVAAERVDGLYARTDLRWNFGISGFAGSPVETGEDLPGNSVIYGTRLSHQGSDKYRVGVSYLKEEKDSEDFREEQGLDLWAHPMDKVDIVGRSNYNALTEDWMEHTYNLVLGPFDKLRLTTEASWIDYEDYFTGATMSAFFLQSGLLDPQEEVRRLGEEIAYAFTDKISAAVDYRAYNYELAGNADYYGGSIRYSLPSAGAGFSIHRMDGDTDELKYSEYRIYGYKKINKMDVAVDLLNVNYDASINGVSNAYAATIAGQYALMERLKLGADLEYQKNPDYDKDIRLFLKAVYHFDIARNYGKITASAARGTEQNKRKEGLE